MKKGTFVASVLGATLALAGGGLACFSERTAVTQPPAGQYCSGTPPANVVVIRDFSFTPAEARVSPGSTVIWANCGDQAHTSTSDAGVWDSQLISPGFTYSRTFDQAGSFPYHCEPHPFMTATVVVE